MLQRVVYMKIFSHHAEDENKTKDVASVEETINTLCTQTSFMEFDERVQDYNKRQRRQE